MKTLHELKSDLEEEIKNNMGRLIDERNYADQIAELADGWIPDNHGELAELLCSDHSLASVDDYGLLPENPDVWQIIQVALMDELRNSAMQDFQTFKDNYESDKDELEDSEFEIGYVGRSNYSLNRKTPDGTDGEEEVIKDGFSNEYEVVQFWLTYQEGQ